MSKAIPIFIYGYMHSGTSLLFNVLSSHPQIVSFKKEINLFQNEEILTGDYLKMSSENQLNEFFSNLIGVENLNLLPTSVNFNHEDLKKDYLTYWQSLAENARYFLDGSPNNYLYVQNITKELSVNVKAISIIRDPRDTIASKKKRWKTTNLERYEKQELRKKKLEKGYSVFWDSLSIKKSYEAVDRVSNKEVLRVSYEDLTANYQIQAERIAKFLHVNLSEFVLPENVDYSNAADTSTDKSGIYQNSGNYRDILSRSEILFIQFMLKDQMIKNGYTLEKGTFFESFLLLKYILVAVPELLIRLVKRMALLGPSRFFGYLRISLRRFIKTE